MSLGVLLLGTGVAEAATPIAASSVAAGRAHSCAVLTTGKAVCWGSNAYGQLGDGTKASSSTPVEVAGLDDAASISINQADTTCAIRTTGQALCWGLNSNGQIGDGTKSERTVPTPVSGLGDAKAISVGAYHSCAIRNSGQAVCWGDNSHGQLGDDSTTERLTPTNVSGLADAKSIVAGENHTCAVHEAGGQAVCWGYDALGMLGRGSTSVFPVKTPGAVKGPGGVGTLEGIVQIAAGSTHSCALAEGGQVYCWGDNYFGRLGDDTTTNTEVPVAVHDMADAKFISAGYASSCAIRESGQALCWGSNAQGRLGDGTETERHTPAAVSGLGDATQMGGKLSHMCAVRVSGQTVCWGDNKAGQLGDGSKTSSFTPVVVVFGAADSGGSTPTPTPTPPVKTPVSKKGSGDKAKRNGGKGYRKCLARTKGVYKKALKSAKRKRGKARRKALKSAKKRKRKLVRKCKKRFHKRGGKKNQRPHKRRGGIE